MLKKNQYKKGFGLVEVMVGAGIITIALLGLIASYNVYLSYAFSNQYNVRAASLLEEGVEAVKFIRDANWTSNIATLAPGTTYYLSWNGSAWSLTTTPQPYVDSIFERTLTFAAVNRDSSGEIVTSGGSVESGTKLVTVNVSYSYGNATTTQTISTYITNIQSN